MTIYETIKAAISVKQAAEHYGLKVNRNGMACCPFHNDRHPSMKLNEEYFFCFGCGAKGDVIDFVARLFDLSSHEAAQKLASDFGLDPKPPTAAAMVKPKRPYIRQFREDEMLCFRVLMDYLHLLEDWKVRYAPKTPDDALDDRFVEACQMLDYAVKAAIIAVRDGVANIENRTQTFKMRPEQTIAVQKTMEYFKQAKKEEPDRAPKFLWNAKMRFGKTFATYDRCHTELQNIVGKGKRYSCRGGCPYSGQTEILGN